MAASPTALRAAGVTTSLLAACLLAAGALLPRWWVGTEGDVRMSVGMRVVELCGGRGCADRGLEGLGTGPGSWHLLGATAFAAAWVAVAFLLAAAAGALLAGRGAGAGTRWPGRLAVAAAGFSLFALVLGGGFAWTYPGFAGLGPGPSLFLFMIGAALGVGGAGVLLRRAAG